MGARQYEEYGISKQRWRVIMQEMNECEPQTLLDLARSVDEYLAKYLVENIIYNISFERLEIIHGEFASKSDFYRKRRMMFHLMDLRMKGEH